MPAGTGVWVVKTPLAATTSSASRNESPSLRMSRRIRSSPRNAQCPSFMWKTRGRMPSASSARMPPIPSTISCRMRSLAVAAVQLVGDVLEIRRVLGDVGVEQHERDPAHLRPPRTQHAPSRPASSTVTRTGRLRSPWNGRIGMHREVVDRVALLLPALGGQVLAEVALLVEQADADERHARARSPT